MYFRFWWKCLSIWIPMLIRLWKLMLFGRGGMRWQVTRLRFVLYSLWFYLAYAFNFGIYLYWLLILSFCWAVPVCASTGAYYFVDYWRKLRWACPSLYRDVCMSLIFSLLCSFLHMVAISVLLSYWMLFLLVHHSQHWIRKPMCYIFE